MTKITKKQLEELAEDIDRCRGHILDLNLELKEQLDYLESLRGRVKLWVHRMKDSPGSGRDE